MTRRTPQIPAAPTWAEGRWIHTLDLGDGLWITVQTHGFGWTVGLTEPGTDPNDDRFMTLAEGTGRNMADARRAAKKAARALAKRLNTLASLGSR